MYKIKSEMYSSIQDMYGLNTGVSKYLTNTVLSWVLCSFIFYKLDVIQINAVFNSDAPKSCAFIILPRPIFITADTTANSLMIPKYISPVTYFF